MQVHNNEYHYIRYFAEQRLMEVGFYLASETMNEEQYREEANLFLKAIRQYKPHLLLLDFRDMRFVVAPQTQEWFAPQINEAYASVGHPVKQAMLMSEDFVSNLATEQVIQEAGTFKMHYFSDEQTARDWLD